MKRILPDPKHYELLRQSWRAFPDSEATTESSDPKAASEKNILNNKERVFIKQIVNLFKTYSQVWFHRLSNLNKKFNFLVEHLCKLEKVL